MSARRNRRAGLVRLAILLAMVAAVPTALLVGLNRWAASRVEQAQPAAAPPAEPAGAVATPLLSSRRSPDVLHERLATGALRSSLQPVADRLGPESCLTVAVDGGEVFDDNGPVSARPASNMKLVVGAVALDVLGADHRYTTEVRATGRRDGSVDDLYLVGGGDPLLGTRDYPAAAQGQKRYPQPSVTPLEDLADRVVAAGVTEVRGRVVGDDSRYDEERYVPTWEPSYRASGEAGPLAGLLVNDGFAGLQPLSQTADPATHAAQALTDLLRQRGVQVAGSPAPGRSPADAAAVAALQSAPLGEILGEMLTTSDNNTAELLLKEVGLAARGVGSRAAGKEVVTATLQSWGVPVDGVAVVDGSGLDRANRLTCDAILAVLGHLGPSNPVVDGLALAGRTGTLAPFFVGTPAEGRLRAKTGTLRDTKALSGVVDAADGTRHVAFSYLYNGPDGDVAGLEAWDELGRALAAYPQAPPVDQLGPLPPVAGS